MTFGDKKNLDPLTRRPTVMEVDLRVLGANYEKIKRHVAPAEVMPTIKANAYGHGLVECARYLQELGAKQLGVAFVEEGIELRKAGITVPILVMGAIFGQQIRQFIEYNLDITASSVEKIEAVDLAAQSLGKRARVHLKFDTGMERVGVHYYSAEKLFEKSLECLNCDVVGVYSHLVMSEDPDNDITRTQLERFEEAISFYEKRSLPTPRKHIANSGGVLHWPETHMDMVRPGVSLFGVYPSRVKAGILDLEPVMKLSSRVVYFKVVKQGAGVSYCHTWHAPEQTRVVTVPIGYGDGFSKGLSNKGSVLIGGIRHSIVGAVCMDQTMVNIGPDGTAYNGDEVVLIGKQGDESISVEDIAETLNTCPHEILVSTNLRVPRHFIY